MKQEIVTTCTRDCPNACGLIAKIEGGRVLRLRGNPAHPLTKGFSCRKCADFIRRGESADRIRFPLRKTRGGEWQRISWRDALDEVAERMVEIREDVGAEGILAYRGFAQRTALKLLNDRFFNLFGPVTGTQGTLCGGTGEAAQSLDFGKRISHDPADHFNSRSMIVWGRNPSVTNPYLLPAMADIRKRGGRVFLIDPVASETARHVDVHLQPRPGSDRWLALAAAKVLLTMGTEDRDFLAFRCEGYERYREILDSVSLEDLSSRCDLPVRDIELLAGLLCDERPTAIVLGWGLHRWEWGHQTVRAIDSLGAVAGTIGVSGGGVSQGFDEYAPFDLRWSGDSFHPAKRRLLMPAIGREILATADPQIRMIFVTCGNPVCMAPDSGRVKAAFESTPFVVAAGHFLDDTASTADIFLPTTTFLEEEDIVGSYGHNWIGPVNRAVEPPGECRSDFEIFSDLASRFPFADEFRREPMEWLRLLLAPVIGKGVSLAELLSGPVRIPDAPMVPYAERAFATPSGKFRLLDEIASPAEDISMSGYPYQLLSVSPGQWLCSEQTPGEQHLVDVFLHPDEAVRCGVGDGDLVEVESRVGRIEGRLRVSPHQRRDVVVVPRGKWLSSGSGVNLLTGDLVSRLGNGAAYYETTVRVSAAGHRAT